MSGDVDPLTGVPAAVDRNRVPMDRVAAWVEASCAAQGIEVKITDAVVIDQLAPLFGASADDARSITSKRV